MEKTLDESQEFTYTRLSAAISWVCFSGKTKAKPAGSRVVTALQGKIMVQKQPCGPSPPTLGCPALQSLPSQFLGQQSPTRLMLGHRAALLPSSRSQEIRPSPSLSLEGNSLLLVTAAAVVQSWDEMQICC